MSEDFENRAKTNIFAEAIYYKTAIKRMKNDILS